METRGTQSQWKCEDFIELIIRAKEVWNENEHGGKQPEVIYLNKEFMKEFKKSLKNYSGINGNINIFENCQLCVLSKNQSECFTKIIEPPEEKKYGVLIGAISNVLKYEAGSFKLISDGINLLGIFYKIEGKNRIFTHYGNQLMCI